MFHCVKDDTAPEESQLQYEPASNIVADLLTKTSKGIAFQRLAARAGMAISGEM